MYSYDRSSKVAAEPSYTHYENRLEALQASFVSEVGTKVEWYVSILHQRLASRPPFDSISSFLSWDFGGARQAGPNKWTIRVWQKDRSNYPDDITPVINIEIEFETSGKVSYEAKAGTDSMLKKSANTSSSSVGMEIGEAWEKKLTGSVDYGQF